MRYFFSTAVLIIFYSKIVNCCLPTQTIETPVASPCSVCPDIFKPSCIDGVGSCASASDASVDYVIGPVANTSPLLGDADTCSTYVICPHGSNARVTRVPSLLTQIFPEDEEVLIICQQTTGPDPGNWYVEEMTRIEIDAIECRYQ